ncbi:MAG: hypothetical protein EU529_00740 [Promethearchaeota archaeon]|nr:MAG: hypothetical protein EU529_00740 [Candidatus Lokiarchaeota archaeon]
MWNELQIPLGLLIVAIVGLCASIIYNLVQLYLHNRHIKKYEDQLNLEKKSLNLQILIDIFREYRGWEFKKKAKYILEELDKNNKKGLGLWDLDAEIQEKVIPVCHFFDFIGLFVAKKYTDPDFIIDFMDQNIIDIWNSLESYIQNTRRNSGRQDYQNKFEELKDLIEQNMQNN